MLLNANATSDSRSSLLTEGVLGSRYSAHTFHEVSLKLIYFDSKLYHYLKQYLVFKHSNNCRCGYIVFVGNHSYGKLVDVTVAVGSISCWTCIRTFVYVAFENCGS